MNKRIYGQFFTTTNPFVNEAFVRWFKSTPPNATILEPFAGANNIVWMIRDLNYDNDWACFDIDPVMEETANAFQEIAITCQDTFKNYPQNYQIAITNPPYLAKNSATRRELPYSGGQYDDVYKKALEIMLTHTPYVAAIIPESFLTQNLFHNRLYAVVSLTCRMFEDTEVPVCLALFVPEKIKATKDDFEIWGGNRQIGTFKTLAQYILPAQDTYSWKFNDPNGLIGLHCVDSKVGSGSIKFVRGETILPTNIKESSRSITRISLPELPSNLVEPLIEACNKLLMERRKETKDVFMTSFKGLRSDGKYRRRLDFRQARDILNVAYSNILSSKKGAA